MEYGDTPIPYGRPTPPAPRRPRCAEPAVVSADGPRPARGARSQPRPGAPAAPRVLFQAPARPARSGAHRPAGQVQGDPAAAAAGSSSSPRRARWLVSIAAYTLIWGFWFAVGFVVLLLVHEMGHVIQLRREGIQASAPMFIPFLGAVVAAKSLGDNALAEARVGLAGPSWGPSARGRLPGHLAAHRQRLSGARWRYTGFFLNLFNLLPVVPLDGGRAMAAMSPWMWFVGLRRHRRAGDRLPQPDHPAHRPVRRATRRTGAGSCRQRRPRARSPTTASRPRNRLLVGAVYLGLVALLVIGMDATHLAPHARLRPASGLLVARRLLVARDVGTGRGGPVLSGPHERVEQRR